MKNRSRQLLWLTLAVILLAGGGLWAGWKLMKHSDELDAAERFIKNHMMNANGSLATYLKSAPSTDPELAAGREALSESLGLWMEAAVLRDQPTVFAESYEVFKRLFRHHHGYVYWKLTEDGQAEVTTTALGDDLRIARALLQAGEQWDESAYIQSALALAETLLLRGQHEGYLVDFYDFGRHERPTRLSLVYVDVGALDGVRRHGLLSEDEYARYITLLLKMPDEPPFYPKYYDVANSEYGFDEQVNMIDQLIVGLHAADAGRDTRPLLEFIRQELDRTGEVAGRYDRRTSQPATSYESPAVYGLAILLAVRWEDILLAERLNERMLELRDHDGDYPGGYVFDGNTHIFDNLLPLIGGTALSKAR
ncbi:glycosyl hydrolase [Paenibacillus sp. 1P07SE]|uniref:glycosyl hydrolase n=1 Tax=Paenibacillus sp. 1P07SE TaxID=3132209 RepID=UPI0039A5A5FC